MHPTMSPGTSIILATLLLGGLLAGCSQASATSGPQLLPTPSVDVTPGKAGETQTATFAGGCFWGIQAVFQHVKGVQSAISGYAGGSSQDAHYDIVSSGTTRHAESVKVTFDPTKVTYGQLLRLFFSIAHDPTQLNAQGPDSGTQYRSQLFTANSEQQRVANAYIAQLTAAKLFNAPIVTKVSGPAAFYRAEAYHQDYATIHPDNLYIVINDAPKVEHLKQLFAPLYQDKPTLANTGLSSR